MDAKDLASQLGAWPTGSGALRDKLTRALAEAIAKGQIHPGIRLPSERALSRALSISRTTVVGAYDALRESGWVESRVGSGTRVSETSAAVAAARGASRTAALATSPLLGLLSQRSDRGVIDFAIGCPLPTRDLPMELFHLPAEEYAALVQERLYYPLGLEATRQAVARYYSDGGLRTTPEQVLVTNGAQHAIALCAALFLQKGDTVLAEDPGYFGALDAFRVAGARVSPLFVGAGGVAVGDLRDRILATASRLVYLMPTFQNPTGAVMPPLARKEVAKISSELAVPVIEDGALSDLVFEGSLPPAIATFVPEAPVLTIGSLSKLVWPGLRAGWVRGPEPIIERLARLKSANDLASALLPQAIAARLLGAVDRIRESRRSELVPRRDLLAELLAKLLPSWRFKVPRGGLFLWVKLPSGDSREFAQVALRHGTLVLPGPAMSSAGQHARFLRLPFLWEEAVLRRGAGQLARAWREYSAGGSGSGGPTVSLV
jgi:DNA-binding transcriptional MocR family regulator